MATSMTVTALGRWQLRPGLNISSRLHSVLNFSSSKTNLKPEIHCAKRSDHLHQGSKCLRQMQPSFGSKGVANHKLLPFFSPTSLGLGRLEACSPWQNAVHDNQYVCPSRLSEAFSQLTIMDGLTNGNSFYDCPVSHRSVNAEIISPNFHGGKLEILEPPAEGQRNSTDAGKEAKEIMRIRHKKMKKHKLRKLRKRMYFLWKRQKAARKARRDTIYWKEISDIKKEAEDFDAETFVRQQLEKARKGGFYLKVLD